MKKKMTEEYINEVLAPIVETYTEDRDILNLYNTSIEVDEDILPLAIYAAIILDVTTQIEAIKLPTKNIDTSVKNFEKYLTANKNTVDNMAAILATDNPILQKMSKKKKK